MKLKLTALVLCGLLAAPAALAQLTPRFVIDQTADDASAT